MKKNILLLVLGLTLSVSAQAHRAWLLPSSTVLSGQEPWLTVDAAIANSLFYFDHVPMRLNNLVITAPDGSTVKPENSATGKLRSVFDIQLKQTGTHRIAVVNEGLFARYKENGEDKRWRGTAETLAKEGIAAKPEVNIVETISRVETFVTAGKPDRKVFSAPEKGMAMLPETHPNDLAVGETATFQFLLDGKPKPKLMVSLVPGATRYRDDAEQQVLRTDEEGKIKITWPKAGTYHLETGATDKETTIKEAHERRASYSATFEVLP